jgi:hypothetical protein
MHFQRPTVKRAPKWQVLRSVNDVDKVEYVDGMAEVEVPIELVHKLPLKNHERHDSPRLRSLMAAIRARGYSSMEPIVVRIGRAGRWVVVDGGHRLTAAQLVAREYWANLFSPKVGRLSFLVYKTPLSYSRAPGHVLSPPGPVFVEDETPGLDDSPAPPAHFSRKVASREIGPEHSARPFSARRSRCASTES